MRSRNKLGAAHSFYDFVSRCFNLRVQIRVDRLPQPRLKLCCQAWLSLSRAAVASRSARSFIASPAWPRTHRHST
jgi:hypothetical protein